MEGISRKYHIRLSRQFYYKATPEEIVHNQKAEKAIRQFLLNNADMVRLTSQPIHHLGLYFKWPFLWKKSGGEQDPKFQNMLEALKTDFIEKIINNERYQVTQFENSRFEHYLYRLSPKIKELINQETLFWYNNPDRTFFYCMEDPTFYKNKELLAYVITHEQEIYLNLYENERRMLEAQGVDLTLIPF